MDQIRVDNKGHNLLGKLTPTSTLALCRRVQESRCPGQGLETHPIVTLEPGQQGQHRGVWGEELSEKSHTPAGAAPAQHGITTLPWPPILACQSRTPG